jgi:SNF2 family DNA or RNA helicase
MSDLTSKSIATEAAMHKRFTEQDVNNYWTVRATEYAKQYSGDFKYMMDMRELVESAIPLSAGRVKGILNCARQEGEKLNQAALETSIPVVKIVQTNTNSQSQTDETDDLFDDLDFSIDAEVNPDATPVAESPHMIELNKINAKIKEIQASMESMAPGISDLDKIIDQGKKDEELLLDEFTKKINDLREARRNEEIQRASLAQQLREIETELENQRRLHALTIQQLAAEQEFAKTKKQFEALRQDMPWNDSIMPFQWDDVCFMAANFLAGKNGVLNANDMGLGKTFESGALIDLLGILFAQKYDRLPRILWLTKKTLRYSTMKELRRWNDDRKLVALEGDVKQREFMLELAVGSNAIVVANYDQLNTTGLDKYEWDLVFMDEVHKLKGGASSKPTQVFLNTKEICHKAKFIVPMSGSPIQNHPKEMWTYLHIFAPDRFPDVRHFERNYCFGWGQRDEDGNPIVSVDWEKIIRAMKDRVIRHSKQECLPDLPDKVREFRYVEMEGKQLEIYNQLRTEFFVWLDDQKDAALTFTSILAQLTRLRQAAIIPSSMQIKLPTGEVRSVQCEESAKIDEAMEILEQLVGAGEQVVVFSSQFNEPLREISRRISNELYVRSEILSGESSSRFEQIENDFQQGDIRVLLVNMKTGGEGLNLQKSDKWPGGSNNAIFLDLWWNPKFNEQAEDRLHRQGQKDAVTIHVLQAEGSVDSFIAAKLEEKEQMIEGIMERDELRKGADWKSVLMEMI